ncbi:MAG: YhcB family protein [Gammaproteobacteria bacterium]|nr:YhcB family protein [Gammaproteobacteria bacterium]MDH5801051.1 YhcB family protein [Gammaproteobacteria bacterium]
MVTWVVFLSLGLLVGMAAGVYFGQMDIFRRRQREELKARLENAENELSRYKMEVTEHFLVTASLVNSMTESYQAVHEHLAKGANRLCDSTVNVNRLNVTSKRQLDELQVERTAQRVTEDAEPLIAQSVDSSANRGAGDTELDSEAVQNVATTTSGPETGDSVSEQPKRTGEESPRKPTHRTTQSKVASVDNGRSPAVEKASLHQIPVPPDVVPEPTGVKPQETVADLLTEAEGTAGVPSGETPSSLQDIVEPPSTPEALSLEDDEPPTRTVH